MATTDQLKRWCVKNRPVGSTFLGVYAADRLPDSGIISTAVPCSFIVNYDPHDLPGSHWCAVIATPTGVSWFDSYGLPPDASDLILGHYTNFRRWLTRVCAVLQLDHYTYNTADLQSLGETTCGLWAAFYVTNGPKNGWSPFGSDLVANDALIRQLVRLT